jgi:hypothetical protein
MPTSAGIAAHGTLVARQDTPGGSFDTIAELTDIVAPPLTRPSSEITPHQDNIDSYVVGVRRRGEMTLVLNFLGTDPTHDEAAGLIQAWGDGSLDGYQITFKDGCVWIFSGYVTNVAPATPVREGGQAANVTIRPSGGHKIEDEEYV